MRILQKTAKELSNLILQDVRNSIDEFPYGFSEEGVIDKLAEKIETIQKYRIKDFELLSSEYKTERLTLELSIYKNNRGDVQETKCRMQHLDIAERVLQKAKQLRKNRNQKTSKVDTNLLTHSPFFVGGSKKRKEEAKANQYVDLDKKGLRKLTYQNKQGELLTTKDARTLLTLFALWEEQEFQPWLSFTEYQLITKMNMGTGGSIYQMVKSSLERLRNTSVVLQQAYDVDSKKRTVTERFSLIIADKFTVDEDKRGNVWAKKYDIQFSPYIYRSFNGGYCTLISLAVFNELESDIAKAIYLLISGIKDMDENNNYFLENENYEIPLDELYNSLFLEGSRYKNKNAVDKGCSELKDVDIINDYTFLKDKNKFTRIRIEPSNWLLDILTKRKTFQTIEEKTEQISLKFEENLS